MGHPPKPAHTAIQSVAFSAKDQGFEKRGRRHQNDHGAYDRPKSTPPCLLSFRRLRFGQRNAFRSTQEDELQKTEATIYMAAERVTENSNCRQPKK